MNHQIRHALPPAHAKAAGIKIFSRYAKHANLRWAPGGWSGAVDFELNGKPFTATFQITTTTIEVSIPNVPLLLVPMVKIAIDAEAKRAIAEEQKRVAVR